MAQARELLRAFRDEPDASRRAALAREYGTVQARYCSWLRYRVDRCDALLAHRGITPRGSRPPAR